MKKTKPVRPDCDVSSHAYAMYELDLLEYDRQRRVADLAKANRDLAVTQAIIKRG